MWNVHAEKALEVLLVCSSRHSAPVREFPSCLVNAHIHTHASTALCKLPMYLLIASFSGREDVDLGACSIKSTVFSRSTSK